MIKPIPIEESYRQTTNNFKKQRNYEKAIYNTKHHISEYRDTDNPC